MRVTIIMPSEEEYLVTLNPISNKNIAVAIKLATRAHEEDKVLLAVCAEFDESQGKRKYAYCLGESHEPQGERTQVEDGAVIRIVEKIVIWVQFQDNEMVGIRVPPDLSVEWLMNNIFATVSPDTHDVLRAPSTATIASAQPVDDWKELVLKGEYFHIKSKSD